MSFAHARRLAWGCVLLGVGINRAKKKQAEKKRHIQLCRRCAESTLASERSTNSKI
jgi:hypothetical protein